MEHHILDIELDRARRTLKSTEACLKGAADTHQWDYMNQLSDLSRLQSQYVSGLEAAVASYVEAKEFEKRKRRETEPT